MCAVSCFYCVTLYSDSFPHLPNSDYNQSEVLQLIRNVTSYLTMKFPNAPIYPLLGNHDVWPANEQPDTADKYYVDILEKAGWSHLLNTSEASSFKQGFCIAVEQFCNSM